ncbi:hypothetical protein TUN205_07161, partial [Pyrenophora tritici-repentis]
MNFIRKISRVVKEKAQIHKDEVLLHAETHVRVVTESTTNLGNEVISRAEPKASVVKESLMGLTNITNRVMSSIEPFQLMGRVIPKLKASMAAIDKFKKSRSIAKGRIWKQRHAESKRKLKVFLTRQEDVEEFERREAERNTRRWRLQEQQEAQRREEHAAWLKSRPARPVTPSASKSPEKVAETPVVTETPEERQRFINDRLT